MSTTTLARHTLSLLSVGILLSQAVYANPTQASAADELAQLKQRIALLEQRLNASAPTVTAVPTTTTAPASSNTTNNPSTQGSMWNMATAQATQFSYKGYIKLDALASRYDSGSLATGDFGRDFYAPSKTPVGTAPASQNFDLHAKQSRLILGTQTALDNGKSINSHIELDFMVNTKGNKRVSNGYEPELRQAFVQYDQWLAGQAWSNFMDVAALPDTLDFVGPTEGTVFNRQAQLRYQHGNWRVSMEGPETTLTDLSKASIASGAARLPDLTARYQHNLGASGYWSAALLLRELRHQVGNTTENETGAGVSLSGRYNFSPQTNLRGALNYGDGIGRYIGLNLVNDAVIDANGQLQPIEVTAGFLAFQHQWQPRLRSSVGVSFFQADPSSNTPALDLTTDSRSAHLNLIYQLQPKLEVGAELSRAERTRDDGAEGSMNRLQLSAKYNF
ncbi:MAG: DcaP family trimeric outer membrane transporter [Moraxellaceae bacterium]